MADETPENEAVEAEATETEAVEAEATEAAPEAAAPDPEPKLPPKEARRHARQRQPASRRPASPEERVAQRKSKAAARSRRRQQEKAKRTPAEGTPPAEPHVGNPQFRTGTVVSDKADKTITVRVEVVRRHPVYEKVIRRSATIHVHDERNDAHQGDLVRVVESRPLSRTKRWRLVEVLERAK
jgi:small subunit ribosomal protein S17